MFPTLPPSSVYTWPCEMTSMSVIWKSSITSVCWCFWNHGKTSYDGTQARMKMLGNKLCKPKIMYILCLYKSRAKTSRSGFTNNDVDVHKRNHTHTHTQSSCWTTHGNHMSEVLFQFIVFSYIFCLISFINPKPRWVWGGDYYNTCDTQ